MANQDDTSIGPSPCQPGAREPGPELHAFLAHARVYEQEAQRVFLVTQALELESRRHLELARETERVAADALIRSDRVTTTDHV
jgi:hypothetical protein